ncbi:DUF3545 family protein [Pseudoalteromonas tunicata]|jgi:hypothetical protein|uniref:DUF3545 domain-containing protein n=1 Tax=Pseudoalteromonas tunicata D2 TaxID=87626 RepID=A4C6P7_9GAMM|nr:DUF3545 family protein [Pseudoalteromonas tunicata]ATC95625.1 hypothetical protein PTUN_a3262 [Pseudoalteromonas tunicata]AXT31193.1 DUF3545 family protein [Pseudoalteromonas tunicata]EAR29651.1 hypothetical protein PTD2_12564 [Pseudoalteromonas tunicata D2]MDP4984987.1 DUF3545 family protein [Pseudoalteromonas tunicata]MDP5212548.1 DUF3545 family protein [Pseudoalteromonas tunicata]
MDNLDDILTLLESPEATVKSSKNQKRKWREIEALKDKHRLRKELQDLDWSHEIELEELNF